eukprot:6926014-Prymnesium_polylepis.1
MHAARPPPNLQPWHSLPPRNNNLQPLHNLPPVAPPPAVRTASRGSPLRAATARLRLPHAHLRVALAWRRARSARSGSTRTRTT